MKGDLRSNRETLPNQTIYSYVFEEITLDFLSSNTLATR